MSQIRNIQVLFDGDPIEIPYEDRSLGAIRSRLETIALERQRILFSFQVKGAEEAEGWNGAGFCRVEARSLDLDEMPLRMLDLAIQQTAQAQKRVLSAISMVLINDGALAREFWWELTGDLKQPLVTLTFMPNHTYANPGGGASISQLRKWQLQQLGAILKDVDEACHAYDTMQLAGALETRVMPWLESLSASLNLMRETLLATPQFST